MYTLIMSELFNLEFYTEEQKSNTKKRDLIPNIMEGTELFSETAICVSLHQPLCGHSLQAPRL